MKQFTLLVPALEFLWFEVQNESRNVLSNGDNELYYGGIHFVTDPVQLQIERLKRLLSTEKSNYMSDATKLQIQQTISSLSQKK